MHERPSPSGDTEPDRDSFLRRIAARLPRKGRIRFFLILVLAAACYRLTASLTNAASQERKAKEENHAPARVFGFDSLSALLSRRPPNLATGKDTFATPNGPLAVAYSVDTGLQNYVTRLMDRYRPRYGACAVIDPSGRILAFVSHEETHAVQGPLYLRNVFPAASVFKTITAAAAIETAQYTFDTRIPVIGREHTLYRSQLRREFRPWKELPFQDAYAHSINPVFGRIGMYVVGKKVLEEYAGRFGFNTAIPFELQADTSKISVPEDTTYEMAELASGFNRKTSISPLHGALIASAVAEGGAMPCPRIVDSVSDGGGRCLYRSQPAVWKTPITENTAQELRTMMNRVVEAGTAHKSFRSLLKCAATDDLEYGGKTGSIEVDSLGNIEWFIGYAYRKNDHRQGLALAVVTAHGGLLTVHSSLIGADIFRRCLCSSAVDDEPVVQPRKNRPHRSHRSRPIRARK